MEKDVSDDAKLLDNMIKRAGAATLPQIFIAGQHIGGCTDMLEMHEAGELASCFAAAGIENWTDFVTTTEANQRNMDTNLLVGDSRRAHLDLQWRHTRDFDAIAKEMTLFDMALLDAPEVTWFSE